MSEQDEAVRNAHDALNPRYVESFDDVHRLLARALLALHAENERLRGVATKLADSATHCRMCRDCGDGPCCDDCGSEQACAELRKLLEGKA